MTTSPTFSTCTNSKSNSNTTAMPMAKNDMHQLMQITDSGGNSADLVSSSAVTVDTAVHYCIFHGGKDHKFVLISLPDTILPHEKAGCTKQHDDLLSETSSNTEDTSSVSSSPKAASDSCSDDDSTIILAESDKLSLSLSVRSSSPYSIDGDSFNNIESTLSLQHIIPFHSFSPRIQAKRTGVTAGTTVERSTNVHGTTKQGHPNKSVTFSGAPILVHIVPRVTQEEWPLVYYEQDEIAEFRYEAFLEDCGCLASDAIPSG